MASGRKLVWANAGDGPLVIHRRDLISGNETTLLDASGSSCTKGAGLAVAHGTIAWMLRCKGNDIVQVMRGNRIQATITARGHPMGYLRVTDRYVGFGTGSGPYRQFLYDVRSQQFLRFGTGDVGGDMPGNGAFLSWVSYRPGPRAVGDTHLVRLLN